MSGTEGSGTRTGHVYRAPTGFIRGWSTEGGRLLRLKTMGLEASTEQK